MSGRFPKLRRCFAVLALSGGALWAWYGLARTRETGTPAGKTTVSSTRAAEEVRFRPVEPIQFHLISRTQPTPMSPSFRPPRSQK